MKTYVKKLPEKYGCYCTPSSAVVFNTGYVTADDAVQHLLPIPRGLNEHAAFESRSRSMKTVWPLEAQPWCDVDMVVRQYVHGGLFGKLSGPLRQYFIDSSAMINEIKIIDHLLCSGINAAEPIALTFEYRVRLFIRAFLITKRIPHTINLLQMCQRVEKGGMKLDDHSRAVLCRQITDTIARMHDAGVDHGDLNLKNLLVKMEDNSITGSISIIDYKKARWKKDIPFNSGVDNIKRLWRSIMKWPESRAVLGSYGRDRLIKNYEDRFIP